MTTTIARSGLRSALTPLGHDLERVDVQSRVGLVENRQRRLEQRHLKDLVALLLAAREPFVDRAVEHALVDVEELRLLLAQLQELDRVELWLTEVLALGVERRLEKVGVGDAGDLDRILERHEHAFAGALVGIHLEEVVPVVEHFAGGDDVFGVTGESACERAFARAVRPHDGVDFTSLDVEIDALEDQLVLGLNLKILDI